jgi:ribose/xylose/arabinose/galactoside ABC-type transport system permease subunit
VAAAAVVSGVVALSLTALGRSFLAVGGNRESARLAGIDVRRVTLFAYLASGLTAAVAAIVLTAKFGLADTGAASGAELNAIAAVVIGGTSLSGGQGSVLGSLVGALTIAVLNAGLVLVGVPDTMQGVAIGAVIVVAVLLDRIRRKGD